MVSASLHPKLSSSFVLLVYFDILYDDLCFILRSLFFSVKLTIVVICPLPVVQLSRRSW